MLLTLLVGGGGFQPPRSFPTGTRPTDVALADVDGDGHLDVLTANPDGPSVPVLRGDGAGGFHPAAPTPLPRDFQPHLIQTGDFDEDGVADLALTSHDSFDVVLLLGDGRGGFQAAPASPVAAFNGKDPPHNHGLGVADFDGDGHLDLVTVDQNHGVAALLLGDGSARFTPAPGSPYPAGEAPYLPGIGDLDGDGRPDLAVPSLHGTALRVLLTRDRRLTESPGSPHPVAARPFFVAAADLDADGWTDVLASHDGRSSLTLLRGASGASLRPATPVPAGGVAWKLRTADLNADGRPEVVASCYRCGLIVLEADGAGGLRPRADSPLPAGEGIIGVAAGDLNGDGRDDLVAASESLHQVTVFLSKP